MAARRNVKTNGDNRPDKLFLPTGETTPAPSVSTIGQIILVSGALWYFDGTDWQEVTVESV